MGGEGTPTSLLLVSIFLIGVIQAGAFVMPPLVP